MSRKRALSIVKNLNRTISSMIDVKVIPNEQFPGVRANKQKLNGNNVHNVIIIGMLGYLIYKCK